MSRPRTRKAAGAVASLTALAALSACGTHPGSAATVGSDRISDDHLDEVATALCAAQGASQQPGVAPQELSSRAAREGALGVLINGRLSVQYGESQGAQADQEKLNAAIAANARTISSIPARDRTVFRDTLQEYATGQLMLIQVGQAALAKAGTQNASEQQAVAAGTKLRDAWVAKNVEVSVDPRYGSFSGGALRAGSGSLSTAVSTNAREGDKQQPSADWVSSLPASQKCG